MKDFITAVRALHGDELAKLCEKRLRRNPMQALSEALSESRVIRDVDRPEARCDSRFKTWYR